MTSRQVLAWLAGGAVVVIAWLAHPFATGLLLGALMGFTLQPVHARLARWSGRPTLASVAIVVAAGLAIVGSVVGLRVGLRHPGGGLHRARCAKS